MGIVIDFKTRMVMKEMPMLDYQARILAMDKIGLLEEMVRFQEERSKSGVLTYQMMIEGRYLFEQLENIAETPELRDLTKQYRRHLEQEIVVYRKKEIS
jgi:hypothetical protein